ncbi:hypothetical protein IEQ34_003830 [Dendrobium chrysotoxum]|uniref:Uncharacterized protein n=1 Tax=Dendrobium chrysotoxum TaxID=161865 RepID=A0AAV7HFH5_DENCH|nr:hypothetical protein IEQ34_003830 [Dendrobium chrysotoxum]
MTFRSKWLDMHTRDPTKGWSNAFFFLRNDWGLLEKWGKMRDFLAPLHVGEEDIMRLLKVPNVDHLLYKVLYLNKYIEEEFLFKIDRLQVDLERVKGMITQLCEGQRASVEKVTVLEAENKRSQTLIAEKEAALTGFESSRCLDEGFIRGFLKVVHLVQRKAGVEVEGLTPSQASDDFPPYSDGDEIERELQKAFALEVDNEVVDIE